MNNSIANQYEVILDNKYFLRDLVESISLDESLDDISYHAQVRMLVSKDFPAIVPGQDIRISGIPPGGRAMVYMLHPGVVWECSSQTTGVKHIDVTIFDKTIYLSRSEDEYLFPAGETASQRLKKYASDWGFPVADLQDTAVPLAKAVYRAQSIYSMMQNDLRETAKKSGELFRPRMTANGLTLVKIGGNQTVWELESDNNIEDLTQQRTLEGTVTKVKVLGNGGEDQRSPVLAVEEGEIAKYGTLQKVLQDSAITSAAAAKQSAKQMLSGLKETFRVQCVDINNIRAGDKVKLNNLELIVSSVNHQLGEPGHMTLELSWLDDVRRRYFLGSV